MTYAPGSLVRARGREWVVLPESENELLVLRPLGGMDEETAGICPDVEEVQPAQFGLPDPTELGDAHSCRFLRDAIRLGFRSSAGPFRSFAKISVEPRPYQLVPLLMALKLDPVRLLIADDVGVGKTIEACLVARELLDRGEVRRLAVLCPPHLAEQWQDELSDKFHIDAELVLHSTAGRLERTLLGGQSIFEAYPFTVVSTDFIKSERRREEFFRSCPELVIIDEAHTCSFDPTRRSQRHQRHHLVRGIAEDQDRHLILVTATPHTGNEEAFRSLLAFLNPDFANLPSDLRGTENESIRRQIAAQFIQRRRGDIRAYLDAETRFPTREEREETYKLSPDYLKLFQRALQYAREVVLDDKIGKHRQRVRWWSMLALLRALASSPAAAAATLRTRAAALETGSPEEADEVGRRAVLDMDDVDGDEIPDLVPGSDFNPDDEEGSAQIASERRRLLRMARDAERLQGAQDEKIKKAATLVKEFLDDRFHPILFCRFIATADYVANELRNRLPKTVEVISVTGDLPPKEREERVLELAKAPERVLVCTDCLSEGINLQDHFTAVMHYDLSWNPTRHEQREGRADRFGQPASKVRCLTYYGTDNQIDGIVLDVLIRKHKQIRSRTGVIVPVPRDSEQVIEAIFEGLLLREETGTSEQLLLPSFDALLRRQREELHTEWEEDADRETRSRTMFAQQAIRPEEVVEELRAAQTAVGSGVDVEKFVREAFRLHGAIVSESSRRKGTVRIDISPRETSQALKDAIGEEEFTARFELPVQDDEVYLHRTHPVVEGLANYVANTALDSLLSKDACARRAGVVRTRAVSRRTTLLLVRFRYDIVTRRGEAETTLLAEDCRVIGFEGSTDGAQWLSPEQVEPLLQATPDANIHPDQAATFIRHVTDSFDLLRPHLEELAKERAAELRNAHRRVRDAARMRGVAHRVEPKLPPDLLGIYVYLPVMGG